MAQSLELMMINALEAVVFTSNVGYSNTGGSKLMTPDDAGAVNRHTTFCSIFAGSAFPNWRASLLCEGGGPANGLTATTHFVFFRPRAPGAKVTVTF